MFSDSDFREMPRKCAVCTQDSRQSCSACRSVAYCSVEHQKKHWKVHKKNCSYFHVKDDPELGKGLVASRDIKAGTIILEELPIIVSPSCYADTSCTTCGSAFSSYKPQQLCLKCAWPVCSVKCAKLPTHATNECNLFATKGFSYPPPFETDSGILSMFLRLIRACCLKKKHPGVFQEVFELSSEYHLPEINDYKYEWLEVMKPHFSNLGLHMRNEEWNKLSRIMMINANNSQCICTATNLYLKASRINHSCIPNCSWFISGAPEFKKQVHTTTAVRKGEPLTVSYYPKEEMCATKYRQEKILKSGFQCKCARCIDPTELGTYSSGIVCKPCQPKKSESIGYFLPEYPLDLSADATWKCNNCGSIKAASEILPHVEALGKFVAEDLDARKISDGKTLMEKCKRFVAKHSGKSLHPNHWVIQNAMRAIVDYFSGGPGRFENMDSESSQYFVKCALHMLAFLDVVTPGLTHARAENQLWLSFALQAQKIAFGKEHRFREVLGILEQLLDIQREAFKYYELGFPKKNGQLGSADALRHNIECTEKDQLTFRIYLHIQERLGY